jgi:hypothetical protein
MTVVWVTLNILKLCAWDYLKRPVMKKNYKQVIEKGCTFKSLGAGVPFEVTFSIHVWTCIADNRRRQGRAR